MDDLQTDQITYVLPVLMKGNSPTTSSTLWPFCSHWGEGAGNAPGGWLAAPETQGEIAETIYIISQQATQVMTSPLSCSPTWPACQYFRPISFRCLPLPFPSQQQKKMPAPVSKTFAALRSAAARLPLSPSVKSITLSFVAKNSGAGPRYVPRPRSRPLADPRPDSSSATTRPHSPTPTPSSPSPSAAYPIPARSTRTPALPTARPSSSVDGAESPMVSSSGKAMSQGARWSSSFVCPAFSSSLLDRANPRRT